MATDNELGRKIDKDYDFSKIPGVSVTPYPLVGIVKDNLSPNRDGRIRVWIPDFGTNENDSHGWKGVTYASPYFGSTYHATNDTNNQFTSVNHTYGMWMTPPDIGSQVLCTFVNGDPNRGYWFACISAGPSSHMVPAIASSADIDTSLVSNNIKASIVKSRQQYLPVAEFNHNIPSNINGTMYANKKPVHEIQANILFMQGLDKDPRRGAISSSSQRETPSNVFGISTPGRPLTKDTADDPAYGSKVASGDIPSDQYQIPSRKGGHTFVMDDGDVKGVDQLIRLRTAAGHQILMNDDQSFVYIAHKNGTSWIEISDAGINVYTNGDYSVRSEGNMNFHADGDINMQALGSINMDSSDTTTMTSATIKIGGAETTTIVGAKMNMGGGKIIVSSDGKLSMSSASDMKINGSTIDINGSGGGSSIPNPSPSKQKHADTTYDSQVTRLWDSVPSSVDSVVTVLPAHEPWTRSQVPPPLTKEVGASICPPKTGSAPPVYTLPAANGANVDKGTIKGNPAPWSTDVEFLDKVKSVATSLNANYIDVLAFMYNESAGTMDPGIVNSIGATGLIQFIPTTAIALGTTTAALAQLSRVDQMDYVLKYFNYFKFTTKAPTPKLQDLYLCVFWPAAVGKPDNYVIAQAGGKVAQQNRGLQAADGSITCVSVGAAAASKLPLVQQALANAGSAPSQPGTVSSSNGSTITDGSGNPVRTGTSSSAATATTDVGITESSGLSVIGDTCPAEFLSKSTMYSPPSGIGTTAPKFTQGQVKAMMAELGYYESKFNYSLISNDKIGKYQVDATYLASAGYIKPDAIKQYGAFGALSQGESWTNKDNIQSQDDFFSSPNVQDTIQFNEFITNYTDLLANGGILSTDDICTAAGMLFVAHQFRSTDIALEWRQKGAVTDDQGRPGSDYFNQGRYAIDVLAAGGAVATTGSSADGADGGANITGIDPDNVFTFQGTGSGTRSNFDQLNGAFKNAVLQMAQDFKAKTGSRVVITSAYRSPADQDAIYQKWLAAGGGPNNPTAGGITTPAKPISAGGKGSPHNSGVAIDSSQCPLIARTVDLAQYGLRWGGTFTKPDAVHIQMANAS